MGYTTTFTGGFKFSRELTHVEWLELKALAYYDEEEYAVYADNHPDYYNQWQPSEKGTTLEWNKSEKFYCYVEWLEWLIKYYFTPRKIYLTGESEYQGEERDDTGKIVVINSAVKKYEYGKTVELEQYIRQFAKDHELSCREAVYQSVVKHEAMAFVDQCMKLLKIYE